MAVQRPAPLTGRQWIIGLLVAAVVVTTMLAITLGLGLPDIAFFLTMFVVLIGVRFLFDMSGWGRTRYVITDRRLLAKRSPYWWAPEVIRLDEIESVQLDVATYLIQVWGGGQKIEIEPELIELTELKQAVGYVEGNE